MLRDTCKLLLVGSLLLAAGCGKTERLTRVKAAAAPVLGELDDDATPQAVLRPGDLVRVERSARPAFHWTGTIDDGGATRDGEAVEVRRASGETTGYAFRGDLGEEVEVPSAKGICATMGAGKECAGRLRRIALDGGGVLAYEACYQGACRVALLRGGAVELLSLEGLTEMRVVTLNGQKAALATSRWKRADAWTGGSVIMLRLEPHLVRATEITTEELNGTHVTHRLRHGRLSVSPEGVRFVGEEQTTMQNGTPLTTRNVDETYRLSAPVAK